MTTKNDTLELLAPLADAEREKRAKDIMIKRKLAADALRKIDDEASRVLPELEKQKTELKQKIADIESESKKAREDLDTVSWKKFAESQRVDREKNRHSAYLLETHDPEISRTIEFFREKHEDLLRMDTDEQTRGGKKNLLSLKQSYSLYSNNDSIKSALKYCQGAIRELEQMRFDPVVNYQRIEKLKTELPDHTTMREYEMTKPVKSADEVRYHSSAEGLLDAKIERTLGYS